MNKALATIERGFYRVRLFFAVALASAVHQAGEILHLTRDEFDAHGHKLEPLTADEAAAAGVTEATAANIVADVAALPANDLVTGLQSGAIHIDTARLAFPDAFPSAIQAAGASIPAESATDATAEAAAAPAPATAEAAAPAAPDAPAPVVAPAVEAPAPDANKAVGDASQAA